MTAQHAKPSVTAQHAKPSATATNAYLHIITMTREEIIQPENLVYEKPRLMNNTDMHYCPGCSHGVVHKLVAEVIAEMGMDEKTIGVSPEVAPCLPTAT